MIQRDPEHWTADSWAESYGFRKEGRKRAGRTEKWIDGKFDSSINPKDGYPVSDYVDARERRVLEFVVLILYPKKPGRVIKEIGNTIFDALAGKYKVSWDQVLHKVVDKLISVLGKGKPTPLSPYLFHLYSKFDCLRGEEIQQLEIAKECLEMGLAPEGELEPDIVEIESDKGSLSPRKQLRGSPSSRVKTTFRSPKGKDPIRNPDWKDMSCLDLNDDSFQRVQDELDKVQSRYSKMEIVIKGASKLLGDCKAGNICKELKKLREKDTMALEASNAALTTQVQDLKVALALKKDEVRVLKEQQAERLEGIREAIGHSGDVVNKAHLFDSEVKKDGHLFAQKIVTVLVKYGHKIEATLREMRKLFPAPPVVARTSKLSVPETTPKTPRE